MNKIDINQSITALYFGEKYDTRIKRMCKEKHIQSIRELCLKSKEDIMDTQQFGQFSLICLGEVLEYYDLRLGMNSMELDQYAGIDRQEDVDEKLWERRRYEVARELCVVQRMKASAAVEEADQLIRALKALSGTQLSCEPYKGEQI